VPSVKEASPTMYQMLTGFSSAVFDCEAVFITYRLYAVPLITSALSRDVLIMRFTRRAPPAVHPPKYDSRVTARDRELLKDNLHPRG